MSLVKALVAAHAPIVFGQPAIAWAVGDTHDVDPALLSRFAADTISFTVLSSATDAGDVAQAALDANSADSAGAASAVTVTATETEGIVHKTTLTLTALAIALADVAQGGGVKIYDFPEGDIRILGAVGSVAMKTTSVLASTLNAGVTCNWGVGSTVQANGTLATTEQNILPTTAITSSATINVAGAASKSKLANALTLDGTTTPVDAFLNVGVATATDIDADATVTIDGTVTITWINLGDV